VAPTTSSSRLADLVERHHEDLLERYTRFLYDTSVPPSMDRERALDSAADLLRELAVALRDEGETHVRDAELSESAAKHGVQRFELGLDLPTLIREYRGLEDVVFALIEEHPECDVSLRELRVLARFVMGAATRGAEAYSRERDLELDRQAAKHLGFLAHEIRNPLGSIALGLQLAKQAGEVQQSRAVGSVERGIARMQKLVDDALTEVRVRGGGELRRERVDVPAMLSELREECQAELEAKAQRIELDCAKEIHLQADARLLRSALSNLIRNAVKFSRREGTIQVRARTAQGRVIIEVEDECGGLPEGAVQRMFDPFVQSGHDRSGFGLGLAIASQAVRAHEGSLRVHDLPGHGCVFALELPEHPVLEKDDPARNEGGAKPPDASARPA
jgi:signal transduction histidine kinase